GRSVRMIEIETPVPSPFARSLLFGYVAAFMYEGDSPLAERRAAALSLDPALLAELLGRAELRELLDPAVIEQTELELQRLTPERRARDAEGVVDLLRMLGPLSLNEIAARADPSSAEWSVRVGSSAPDATQSDHSRGLGGLGGLGGLEGSGIVGVLEGLARANRVLPVTIASVKQWAVIEDAARLRDALGVPLPIGVPAAFIEPVDDPVGDLLSRYARTHGPFIVQDAAARFGLGTAVVTDTLRRLAADRRVVDGEFRPGATGTEWCSVEVLRRLRSRSLAALRQDVEPVDQAALGRFLTDWQHVSGNLRGIDGLTQVIDQLAGVAIPASAWESLVLPARLANYSQAWLDELTVSGEVVWSGVGALAGGDGWVSLHHAETAPLTLPEANGDETSELQRELLAVMAGGGAYFFRQLGAAVASTDDKAVLNALWGLVWSGLITNDSFSPLRAYLGGPVKTRVPRTRAYRGRSLAVTQAGPASGGGRWSLLPLAGADTTVRAKATAELLLERHGVVTRGAGVSEGIRGGFALAYKVLSGFEDSGRARRGYFVDGLGAAQFATGATIDRLRGFVVDSEVAPALKAVTLAATDPANPYGAALGWPSSNGGEVSAGSTTKAGGTMAGPSGGGVNRHRPGRKAGAIVVMVDGSLALYVERGGKTVLSFTNDGLAIAAATRSLASTVRERIGTLRIERINGDFAVGTAIGSALVEAGFVATPQGLRLRSS
ncbi:MAG: ATP-dependent helicase, partial [Salinibacterium sp.]|nr:ATP-dependent helicase [Salinibacterium sp.]